MKSSQEGKKRLQSAVRYNLPPIMGPKFQSESVLPFLKLLRQRYEAVVAHLGDDEALHRQDLRARLTSLAFAEAFLDKTERGASGADFPLQIAVLGPTQAGKSSVVNWLLGRDAAEVSPLAGYTVHPQGFSAEPDAAAPTLQAYLQGYRLCPRDELTADDFRCYTLERVDAVAHGPLAKAVLWDTPDFDSVGADRYQSAVLRIAALADVAVVVLSKDKYADLAVWQLLGLLEPLVQPTVICLNKVDLDSMPALRKSLADKWRAARQDEPALVVPIPFRYADQRDSAAAEERHRELRATVGAALEQAQRGKAAARGKALVTRHWADWIEPVLEEHALDQEWTDLVATAMEESLAHYERDYLNHPQLYETFQRALAELLRLLEVPGLAAALYTARQVVTWPMRQLLSIGRRSRGKDRQSATETEHLRRVAEHALIRISEALVGEREGNPASDNWRRALANLVRENREPTLRRFDSDVDRYVSNFQPEVERTAQSLYDRLAEHPALLNSLRATRLTTDAAAVALALHTGGIGVHDFVIAPAILSMTSILAEGALGRYVDKAAAELKQRQKAAVAKLLAESLREPLLRLPRQLDQTGRFGISVVSLRAAEEALK